MGDSAGFRLAIASDAAEVLRHLPPDVTRGIRAALRVLRRNPAEGGPLVGELEGLWTYRVRRFRIVYEVDRRERVLRIVAVGHRRRIYDEVAARRERGP